jgi:hypothetical protein
MISKLLPSKALLAGFGIITLVFIGGFTINRGNTVVSNDITGLWTGTFSTGKGFAEPKGTKFHFSFSIYPDGSLVYKSGSNVGRYVYGEGTWSLENNKFKFEATTINGVSAYQQDKVEGYADLDCIKNAFSNGYTRCSTANAEGTWEMTKVNAGTDKKESIVFTNNSIN